MQGREPQLSNNIFFTCSLIEYIARKTKNTAVLVFDTLGRNRVERILELADVYHSDNIDAVTESFVQEANIPTGTFDNVASARFAIPSHWDIGKVYKRLVLNIMDAEGVNPVEAMGRAYHSPVTALINDYNGSFYYEPPQAIYAAHATGELE